MRNFKLSFLFIIIAIIAFTGFYLVYFNNSSVSGSETFFDELINGLMGAMVVAIVTASIFIYQNTIEGNKEKERFIYEKKLDLYQTLARKISRITSDKKISKNELDELNYFSLEIDLVADEDLINKFQELIDKCSNLIDKKISDDIEELIREVIGLARLELEVLKSVSITKEKKDNLERAIQQKRSNEVKFEIIKDYVSDIPTKEIEEKHDIKSVHSRVRKFREQLVLDKYEKWKNLLESEGISIDLNIPLKKGNIKKD